MPDYIVASSKPWHKKKFDKISRKESGQWLYVSTKEELESSLECISPKYIFFFHWNWMVPLEIHQNFECVCFHMTNVPYGRGGSPLQNLIIDGQTETKVTGLRMVEEMDAGPVYAKRSMSLDGRAEEIYLRSGKLCWEMARWIIANEPTPILQAGEITQFFRRKPEQSRLPLQSELSGIYDFIRMMDAPTYPHAFVEHGKFRLEFSHASLEEDEIQARVVIRKSRSDYDD